MKIATVAILGVAAYLYMKNKDQGGAAFSLPSSITDIFNPSSPGTPQTGVTSLDNGPGANAANILQTQTTENQFLTGWTTAINPLSNVQTSISQYGQPFNINIDNILIFDVPPNTVNAHQFVYDPALFPNDGVQIMTNQYQPHPNARVVAVGENPGQLNGLSGFSQKSGIEGAYLFLTSQRNDYGMLKLIPGKPYWINVAATMSNTPMTYLISPQPM